MSDHGEILGYLVELEEGEWRDLKFRVERIRNANRLEVKRSGERIRVSELEKTLAAHGVVATGLRRGLGRDAPTEARYLAAKWPNGRALHLLVVERREIQPACGNLASTPVMANVQLVEVEDTCRRCTKFKRRVGVTSSISARALAAVSVGRRGS